MYIVCIYALESRDAHLEREIAEVEHRPEPIELVLIEVRALAIAHKSTWSADANSPSWPQELT